jgi:hypothetical protein
MNTLFYPPDEMAFAVVHHDVVPHDVLLLLLPSFISPEPHTHSETESPPPVATILRSASADARLPD